MGFFFSQSSKIAQANLETKKFQLASRFFERLSQAKSMIHYHFFSIVGREKKVN
jgi:hypothetical protein